VGTDTNTNMDLTTNSTRRMTSSLTNIPNIIIVSSYTPTQSYITINNSSRRRRSVEGKRERSCAELNHSIQEHTKKEKTEIYCSLCIVVLYPIRYCVLYLCRTHG